jgi:hypothetical protein
MDYETNDLHRYDQESEMVTQEQMDAQRKSMLEALHAGFSHQRDEWVKYRAQHGVERRWREAKALYDGDESTGGETVLTDTLKSGPRARTKEPTRSKVVINIVRPKVDQAVARMCEILLPVDDRNWGIKPTPVPQAVSQMVNDMSPLIDPRTGQDTGKTRDAAAQEFVKSMKDKASKMQDEIDDVLTQCEYNGQQRMVIEDAVLLGTGYMLGPYPSNKTKRTWIEGAEGMSLSSTTEVAPASMRADVWDIFTDPACGNDLQRGLGFYHRRFATPRELRDLVGLPGYDADAIRDVLRQKPTRTRVAAGRVTRELCDEGSYEMWVYYGQVEPDQMQMLGDSMSDPLEDVEDGVIIMIGEKIIGAMASWIPDGSLPLDAWCWRKADDSPNGHGLPGELAHQQRVVNAAWRQVMDDAKYSVGGQFVIKQKMISPADGSYDMYPGKMWHASEDLDDVRQAMHMFEFTAHTAQLLSIATAAMQFADQETSMPQMMGGEKGSQAPETLGGMVMLSNNADTVLRLRVKLYDDSITRRHLRRYYDWMMANSPKREIKGDMDVDARGSTALLEKDIQNQATLGLANVTNNPRYSIYLDPKAELKVMLKAFKVNPDDIMLTDAQIDQAQQAQQQSPPPQDPRIVTAQMGMQSKQLELADRKEQRQADLQLAQGDQQIKREGIAYTSERERSDAEQGMIKMQMDRELAIAKMDSDGILTREEIASKARMQAIDLSNKNSLFNAEASLRVNTGAGI